MLYVSLRVPDPVGKMAGSFVKRTELPPFTKVVRGISNIALFHSLKSLNLKTAVENLERMFPTMPVIPANAGIQLVARPLDSRIRGNDAGVKAE